MNPTKRPKLTPTTNEVKYYFLRKENQYFRILISYDEQIEIGCVEEYRDHPVGVRSIWIGGVGKDSFMLNTEEWMPIQKIRLFWKYLVSLGYTRYTPTGVSSPV